MNLISHEHRTEAIKLILNEPDLTPTERLKAIRFAVELIGVDVPYGEIVPFITEVSISEGAEQ